MDLRLYSSGTEEIPLGLENDLNNIKVCNRNQLRGGQISYRKEHQSSQENSMSHSHLY